MTKEQFASKIKAHRERLGVDQIECADIVGVSSRTVYYWERAQAVPHPVMMTAALALLTAAETAKLKKEQS